MFLKFDPNSWAQGVLPSQLSENNYKQVPLTSSEFITDILLLMLLFNFVYGSFTCVSELHFFHFLFTD